MEIELNNLLWLVRRKVSINSGLISVVNFLDDYPNYLINSNAVIQIVEIFRYITQNKPTYEKSSIDDFIEKITNQLLNYFTKNDNEEQRHELIIITISSSEEIFHMISISLISQLFNFPEKYKFFLYKVVDRTFCNFLVELNGKECKSIQQLFKTIACDDVDFCHFFVDKSLQDLKKLKLIEVLIKSLQDEFIEKFLQLLNDPKYSIVFLYLLNELPENHRITAMNFIIENIDQIDLNAFAKKLSRNSLSMKLFTKQKDLPCELVLKVLLKVTNNFELFEFFAFQNLFKSEIENSEHFLLLFYYVHQRQRKKISFDLANELFKKFQNNDNLFHFFSMLISDHLFLYVNEDNENISQFFNELLNCLLSSCTLASIDLYTTIIMMYEEEKLNKYIDQLFEVFIEADQSKKEFISDSLLLIFTKNKKSFIYSIECVHKYYKSIFPNESIENFDYFSKFIYFLAKYFKLSESIYPIIDFKITPHNKSLIEDKEKIKIGSQKYEFLISKSDTVQSLLKRISFVFDVDNDLISKISDSKNFSEVEEYFKNINLQKQSRILPPPAFFSNETKLSNILLVNIANPKVDENTSIDISNILDYMPDDINFLALINKGIISIFTNNLYVKYVILLDHTQMSQNFIKSLVDYFCNCNDISLKQDILTQMRKHLKIIASLNNIDFSKLYKSFFQMLKSPELLKTSYKDILQFIIDNTKSQLIKYFENTKKNHIINPPEFLWPTLLKLIDLIDFDKEKIIKKNRNNIFGAFLAKNIIPQVKLTESDIDNAFKLLEVHFFIDDSSFYLNLCQQLISSDYEITAKNMNVLLVAAAHVQNEAIISSIFRVFSHYLKIPKFKKILLSIFRNFLRETESLDFAFDPKNYEKNEFSVKFKPSSINSPFNAILQVFQNFENKKNCFSRSFVDPLIENAWPDFIYDETIGPIDIVKRLDFVDLIQFEDELHDFSKPIILRENFNIFSDVTEDFVKCNKTFKFKGLVAFNESNKYVAIVKRNGKLIQIIDDSIEVIQNIPKLSKKFKINFAIYCEHNEIKQMEKYQFQFFKNEKERFEYEKVLLAYSHKFKKFIFKLSKSDVILSYYVKFIIRMKNIDVINEFASKLNSLKLTDHFYQTFIVLIPSILKDIINIDDDDILDNLKKTILQDFLFKIPDKYVVEVCKTYLYITSNCIRNNPTKISVILSLFYDFIKNKKEFFKNEKNIQDILNILDIICMQCLEPDEKEESYYSILNMYSIFDSINFFVFISKINQIKDIYSYLTCLTKLEENHDKIIRNRKNAASYIFLIQKVFKNDEQYLDNFYKKLFLSESQQKDDDLIKDEYFLINLVELSEKNADKLLDVFFNQYKIHDANYLFNEIETFIKKTPSFFVKFLKYLPSISHYFDEFSIEFIPYLNRILSDSSVSNQKNLLNSHLIKYKEKLKSNSISIIDFKTFIIILKVLNNKNCISMVFDFMNEEDKKNDDLFCLFFGELLLSCESEILTPSYLYDIILYKMNDIRVDYSLFFFNKFLNELTKDFFIHPKMKDLYLYCIVHNQINSLIIDDFSIAVYNFLYDIQNEVSTRISMANPPSDRFITISKIAKTKIKSKFSQVKISNQSPFQFIEHTEELINDITFSETISSLFNYLTNQEVFDIDVQIVDSLICNIISNDELEFLDLKIKNQCKLIQLIEEKTFSEDFKSHILDLMIFSQSRDEKAFDQMKNEILNFKTGIVELDEKFFYFLTLKALYGYETSLLPFLMENIDPFVNSVLKMTNQLVLLKKEKQPDLMKLIDDELNQNNFLDYTFDNVKNIILRSILSQ